jgi:hypothetical protein
MQVAAVTFDGFNEIDAFVADHILNWLRPEGWKAFITLRRQRGDPNERCAHASRVTGSILPHTPTRDHGQWRQKPRHCSRHRPARADTARSETSACRHATQCSGALLSAKLGLLDGLPVCTDLNTKTWISEAGVPMIEQPFYAKADVATAGGCLAPISREVDHLAFGIAGKRCDGATAVTSVGQQTESIRRAMWPWNPISRELPSCR